MIVLSIDIGETTGYAYVGGESIPGDEAPLSHLMLYGTVTLGTLPPPRFKPDLVVIERPAYVENKMQAHYQEAIHALRTCYRRVVIVKPADWMPRFNHYPLPGRGVLRSQHEKDAYRMALWALDKYGAYK